MSAKIAVAGNMIVDMLYGVDKYPQEGELAILDNNVDKALGGAACNNTLDFAKLDPSLNIIALGQVGNDENGKLIINTFNQYKNIDTQFIKKEGITSFTAVMNDKQSKQRTFFQFKGANANFSPDDINITKLKDENVKIFHIGYLMLLDKFDKHDELYGTKLSAILDKAQKQGIETSIDVVSSSNGDFKNIVCPALKYTDYCIINEYEAEQITGFKLKENGSFLENNMQQALNKLKILGVKKWIVIHAPEKVYALDCINNSFVVINCLKLDNSYIKGSTGAGDALCTGILYGAYKNKSLEQSIEIGIASAVASLSEVGATEGLKPIDEVMSLYYKLKD